MKISIVIPTLNEEEAIGDVVRAVPQDKVVEIVVVDNGSTDDSANQASLAGARVVREPRRGYHPSVDTRWRQEPGMPKPKQNRCRSAR